MYSSQRSFLVDKLLLERLKQQLVSYHYLHNKMGKLSFESDDQCVRVYGIDVPMKWNRTTPFMQSPTFVLAALADAYCAQLQWKMPASDTNDSLRRVWGLANEFAIQELHRTALRTLGMKQRVEDVAQRCATLTLLVRSMAAENYWFKPWDGALILTPMPDAIKPAFKDYLKTSKSKFCDLLWTAMVESVELNMGAAHAAVVSASVNLKDIEAPLAGLQTLLAAAGYKPETFFPVPGVDAPKKRSRAEAMAADTADKAVTKGLLPKKVLVDVF